jgi:steroid delta-isomerase-like uncharacterized protein
VPDETERNKEVVRRYVAAFNAGDLDALVSLFDPDAVIHGVLKTGKPAEMTAVWAQLHSGLGANLEVESIVAEGSVVAVRYTETGKSREPFRGAEPTGKTFKVTAMEWFSIRGGKIHEWWGARDSASIARQLK